MPDPTTPATPATGSTASLATPPDPAAPAIDSGRIGDRGEGKKVRIVHPDVPDNVITATELAFEVYKKSGWVLASDQKGKTASVPSDFPKAKNEDL